MARRNWIILAALLIASLVFQGPHFALAVLLGGMLVIYSFSRIRRQLVILVDEPTRQMANRATLNYLFRLMALAALIAVFLVIGKVHPIGLAVGLSVVVINLLWTTGSRLLLHKE